jgi:hypothetical protein
MVANLLAVVVIGLQEAMVVILHEVAIAVL